MSASKEIKSALISVFHKDRLKPIINKLDEYGVSIYSTGGTQKFIEAEGIKVSAVEELTSYPSILGGRVKTLHPKVFGGILGRRELQDDLRQLEQYDIPEIDLVIVDLYPFEETVASGANEDEIIEKIDIGGISLIRAAAKNYKDVLIVSSRDQYGELEQLLEEKKGYSELEDRKEFASHAFDISSHYDTAIYNHFSGGKASLKFSERRKKMLRYGENPHQKGSFFGDLDAVFKQMHGKELSYNNLLDVDAAINLMRDFGTENPTFAILKHNNACGLAVRNNLLEAYIAALAADPVSAFGGILISNQALDVDTAVEIHKLFCEVVIAPSYDEEAFALLSQKKNRIILELKDWGFPDLTYRSLLNGVISQDRDSVVDRPGDFEDVTTIKANKSQKEDLEFASILVKHTKSNAIVLAKNKQLIASGTGQTSRVDALEQAIGKAKHFKFDLKDAVMASDAFFPFPDCVEIAKNEGINAVIQPGGSIKDKDSIDYCNANGMAMVFTGHRHFKH
ncbi:MAG: bifunctional phosphoribosylaminoimidazolecarboxamide formyltransferase/IMP cyclohydrolase [Vicingaceae bacterium]